MDVLHKDIYQLDMNWKFADRLIVVPGTTDQSTMSLKLII